VEVAPRGLTVNAWPWVIETEMSRAVRELAGTRFNPAFCCARIGRPEEVAHAVWFLSSRYADYITGQVLNVDGAIQNGITEHEPPNITKEEILTVFPKVAEIMADALAVTWNR